MRPCERMCFWTNLYFSKYTKKQFFWFKKLYQEFRTSWHSLQYPSPHSQTYCMCVGECVKERHQERDRGKKSENKGERALECFGVMERVETSVLTNRPIRYRGRLRNWRFVKPSQSIWRLFICTVLLGLPWFLTIGLAVATCVSIRRKKYFEFSSWILGTIHFSRYPSSEN